MLSSRILPALGAGVLLSIALFSPSAPASLARAEEAGAAGPATASVEGFEIEYQPLPAPDGADAEVTGDTLLAFRGSLSSEHPLAYRGNELAPGQHDVWIERGKGEWFYLIIGSREEDEAPRLRALFRLYEQEDGVERLEFRLKLVSRATKLKFSLLHGHFEGHGNLRIVSPGDIDEE